MQILVSCDDLICSDEELIRRVEGVVEGTLEGFADRVTQIEVHLSALAGHHFGDPDQSCQIEARIGGLAPILVSHAAATLAEAIHDAAAKLKRLLISHLRETSERLPVLAGKGQPIGQDG